MGVLHQLCAIIWKDVYIQLFKRHYFFAAAQILIVLVAFLGIENDRPILPPVTCHKEPCLRLRQPHSYEERNLSAFRAPQLILYTPNTTHAQELMNAAFPSQRTRTMGYADLDTMARIFFRLAPQPKKGPEQRIVALELMSFGPSRGNPNQSYPRKLDFSVSLYDSFSYLLKRHKYLRSFEPLPTPYTQRESVAYCQMALAHAHLAKLRSEYGYKERPYALSTHRVPDGPFPHDARTGYSLTAIRAGLGYMMTFCLLVNRLVEENQSGMREKLRLFGLNSAIYWLGHFLAWLSIGLIAVLFNVFVMLVVPNWTSDEPSHTYLSGMDVTVPFLSLLFFTVVYIVTGMLLSLFFLHSTAAVVSAMVIWVTGYILPWCALESLNGFASEYIMIGRTAKLVTVAFPCMGLHWCFRIIGCAVIVGEPYSLKNTGDEVLSLDNVRMSEIWILMLLYAFALCILIWYLENVLTWAVGVPLDPWYPFTIKYWVPGAQGSVRVIEPRAPDGYHFQQYPPAEAAVTVSQLEYERKEKHILRDTNFKAYNGEILGIVAPNGSGKTSLCNILTGYTFPSAGQVTVLGYDMALQTALARQHVAYVKQNDVLFSDLTVHEHLLFFGSLKDETRAVLDEQITRLQNMFKLGDVMNTLCANLDQSHRKIVSLATALVTRPKVLVMDEPMVKMNPAARNVAWEALTSLKSSMCVIATTANVYEVDTRADRLLFLGYAAHKCYGTTSFIQRRYGWGYSVRVIKSTDFRGRDVVANIRETIPEAHVLQDHMNFATIGLGDRPEFTAVAAVLNRLESQQKNLGIVSFTISFVTMEDIFFRIILEMDATDVEFKKRMALRRQSVAGEDPIDYSMANLTMVTEKQGGIMRQVEKYESSIKIQEHVRALYDLRPQQPGLVELFRAMIIKRRHYTWQTLALPLLCWIVPTCIFAVSVTFETMEGNRVEVRFSADHLIYDLGVFDRSEPVFVSFDKASKAIAEGGYKYYVRSRNFDVTEIEMAAFLEEERRNRGGRGTFVFGAQFTAQANDTTAVGKAVAWYEGDAFHSQSLSLNVLSTVLLRRVTNDSSARVRTVLRPVKKGNTFIISRHLENAKHAEELGDLLSSRLMKLLLLPAAISVVTASFVLFPIDDRVSRSQLMQFVSGTPTFIYWLSNYAWDLLMSLIGLLCLLFPVFFFFHNVQSAVGMAVLIYVSYIHSMLPFVYFYSLVTDSMITGFLMVNFLTCFLGIATTVGYQQYVIALDRDGEMISEEQSRDALLWLLYLFPPFSGSWALVKTLQLGVENAYCTHAVDPATIFDVCAFVRNSADDAAYMLTGLRYCCATYYRSNYTAVHTLSPGSFHRDGAITEIVVMLIEGVVCLLLLVLCEEARTQRWFSRPHPAGDLSALTSEHPDVKEERHHVDKVLKSQDLTKPSLLVVDLKKVYEGQVGVRGVTFHVEPGETFAVMGMQGCGKSTLLGVLSGITAATGGDAYIGATSLRDVARWGKCIGLCPDYDSFLGQLTVRQTLMLYAHVRGVCGPDRVTLVDHIFSLLSLTSVADYTVDSCRASDRRKLAVAVAIVGMPPVLLMDDPATGLDVFAKRTIYKTVNHLRRLNKSAVLLVTTSLCDAVIMSDRMSIMVDGRLRCIGTLEELRATFCRGFVIRIKLKLDAYGKPAARTAVDGSVKAAFPTAVFSGQLARFVEYWVDRMPPWREVARILDDLKTRLQEFSDAVLLSEVTLEHVLLKTAKYQDAPIKTSVVSL